MKAMKPLNSMTAIGMVLALGALAQAMPASAQTAPAAPQASDDEGLQEIVVTAQKRAQNLQDVGISVTAFSGDQLNKLGFTNATDIIRQTPGLNILSSSSSNTNVSVRGVSQNDFADHLEGPVAVYADEGYLGTAGAINGQIYDLERVEVLRGPQGTLFGRNATGGLIHYISREPTRDFEARGQLDVGERGLVQFDTAVSGPLSDTVRARLSIAGIREDGYVKNLIGPTPANKNNISGRLQLVFDLSPKTQLKLMVNGNVNDGERGLAGQSVPIVADANGQGVRLGANQIGTWANIITGGTVTGACGGCDILGYKQPTDIFTRRYSDTGQFKKELFHAQAKLTSDLGWGNLTYIGDYLYLHKDFINQDVDAGPSRYFEFNTYQKYNQFSQEVRLDGTSGKLKWLVGAYYLNMKGNYASAVDFDVSVYVGAPICGITPGFACPTSIPGVEGHSQGTYGLKTESWSGFAQLEYPLTDTLNIIGGLRYTHDLKTVNYSWTTTAFAFPTPTLYNPTTDPSARRTFENVSAKLELDWKPTPDTLVYASYSRGHKGGNWALPVFPPPITAANFPLFPHKQEVLTDYEIGLKTELLDRKVRFNVGAFYYIYDNYQAFSLAGLNQSIFNKNAKAWGGEAELVVAPTRGLELSVSAATMASRVYNMQYPTGQFYTAQLPFSSPLTVNGFARYEWDALGGKLAVQGSFTSVGPHYFDVANEPFVREDRYFTMDARIGYTSANGGWNVALWAKNLNNTQYRLFAIDISALSLGNQNYAPPRQIGGSFGFKF